jgi:hypothetical protein
MNKHGAPSIRLSAPAHPAAAAKQHPLKQPFRLNVAASQKNCGQSTTPCRMTGIALIDGIWFN